MPLPAVAGFFQTMEIPAPEVSEEDFGFTANGFRPRPEVPDPRQYGWHRIGEIRFYVPSPEEIREQCAAFRRGWTDEESAKRLRLDWRPVAVELQTVNLEV